MEERKIREDTKDKEESQVRKKGKEERKVRKGKGKNTGTME